MTSLLESSLHSATNNVSAAIHVEVIYDTFCLAQLIQEPTRVTLDTATLIDHIAYSHPENIPESGVLKIALSDHYAVYCMRKFMGSFKRQQKTITTSHQKKNEKL